MSDEPTHQRDLLAEADALAAEVVRRYEQGEYSAALPEAQRVVALREQLQGPDHADVAIALNQTGMLHQALGRYGEARSILERALATAERARGPDHPDVATVLSNLAALRREQGAVAEAATLCRRALRIREHALGPDHLKVAISLNKLGGILQEQAAYDEAEHAYRRALHVAERHGADGHAVLAAILGNQASLCLARGDYPTAESMYTRALELYEQSPGVSQLSATGVLDSLATLASQRGSYSEAEARYARSLEITERALGPEHPSVAITLNNLAALRVQQGDYAEAGRLASRARPILERAFGPVHAQVANALANLACAEEQRGAYADAEAHYLRSLDILEQLLGPDHPSLLAPLNNLGLHYQKQGAFAQAEAHHARALQICERTHGAGHPSVAIIRLSLGSVYEQQGAYASAVEQYARGLEICERVLGDVNPFTATARANLGKMRHARGELDEAQQLYDQALGDLQQSVGNDNPFVAILLDNLALLHHARGNQGTATQMFERAHAIRSQVLPAEHPDIALSLSHLAYAYWQGGQLARAEAQCTSALELVVRTLGAEHRYAATMIYNLAMMSWDGGEISRAVDRFARASAIVERHLDLELATLPEARKWRFLQTLRAEAEVLTAFLAQAAPHDPRALALALTTTLQRKGRVLHEVAAAQTALQANLSPVLQAELHALQERYSALRVLRQATPDLWNGDAIDALQREVQRGEAELSRQSAAFRVHRAPVTVGAVRAALPAGAALIEIVRYHRCLPGPLLDERWQEPHYLAYVVERDRDPRWVPLGEAAPIEAAALAARHALMRPDSAPREALRALDQLIFAPVRRLVGAASRFIISPDGALHLVPFAALIDEDGRFLVERAHITYVASGRELVRAGARASAGREPLVVAAPDYEGRHVALPGTAAEAAAIARHFPEAAVFTGARATKTVVTTAQVPRFMHIATHGYTSVDAAEPAPLRSRTVRDVVLDPMEAPLPDDGDLERALDAAGLVFAGPDEATARLTARELASLDLRGTQLAVLSACQTGVGELGHGEGAYGLRRALAIAGVETQIVSLWTIDDVATSRLMADYYGRVHRGAGRTEALLLAQRSLLGDPVHAHPFYWAAFVASGDDQPLRSDRTHERTARGSGMRPT